jgi:hypothetical protein
MKITMNVSDAREKSINWLCKSKECSIDELCSVLIFDHFDELSARSSFDLSQRIANDLDFKNRENRGELLWHEEKDGRGYWDVPYKAVSIVYTFPGPPVKKTGHFEQVFIEDN